MGVLQSTAAGNEVRCLLAVENLVGRSPAANVRLAVPYVSAQHASLRWTGEHWEAKDLGSRNGTLLNGRPIAPGAACVLTAGATVCFGRLEQAWELVDDGPPQAMVVPCSAPWAALAIEDQVLALPDADEPHATVYRREDGSYWLECETEVRPLSANDSFTVLGQQWRFANSAAIEQTTSAEWPALDTGATGTELVFRVSADEEHVELYARRGARLLPFGSRAHNYVLLFLARRRLMDLAHGMENNSAGWMYREDVLDALKLDSCQLNLAIFRLRKHLASCGLPGAAGVIERRPGTRQLRLGIEQTVIEVL